MFKYPAALRHATADSYHGTAVADPYRWLEDGDRAETHAFIAAQNDLTLPYLASRPERASLHPQITRLWDVPRTGAPQRRRGVTVWVHNDGLSDQPPFWVDDPDGRRLLLDPNQLSDDGTVAVTTWSLSPDGAHLAYAVSEGGSDWQRIRVRRTATGDDLDDEIRHVKFTTFGWHENGFFYAGFPNADPSSTSVPASHSIYFHTLGTSETEDALQFSNPNPESLHLVEVDPGGYVVVTELRGTSRANGIWYRSLDEPEGPFTRLIEPLLARHQFLIAGDGGFLVLSDHQAPNGRIVRLPFDEHCEPDVIVPETESMIEHAVAAAGKLAVVRLEQAVHHLGLYDYDGTPAGDVELPEPGSVMELRGAPDEPDVFASFESFVRPRTALRWNAGTTEIFAGAPPPVIGIEVERRQATSADGTEVGMFVIRHSATRFPAPTELYGYGGFNLNLTPTFNPARLAFVAAGGIAVVANLRGGSEQGEAWHQAGMLGNKQRVFDDFIACGERLVADGVTTPTQLGIHGRSNGGLLVAAVMLQRPELFGAVLCGVPVTDMLRYQHFTAGRYWTVEYGDAEQDADAFAWLREYSPLHNVEPGVEYPPTLITTAESDDRVMPMHALKFAAELQHAAGGSSRDPLLVRIESRTGHGLGKPTSKLVEEAADVYGFLFHHLR